MITPSGRSNGVDTNQQSLQLLNNDINNPLQKVVERLFHQLNFTPQPIVASWKDVHQRIKPILSRGESFSQLEVLRQFFDELSFDNLLKIIDEVADLPIDEWQVYLSAVPLDKLRQALKIMWREMAAGLNSPGLGSSSNSTSREGISPLLGELEPMLGEAYADIDKVIQFTGERSMQLSTITKVAHLARRPSSSLFSHQTLDSLTMAFNFFSADQEPKGPWEAMYTLQIYGWILAAPFIFATQMQSKEGGERFFEFLLWLSLGSSIILTIYQLLKIYHRFQPVPKTALPLLNYTEEVALGRFDPLMGRDDVIQKVFLCWASSNSETRQHPLLVGLPGVGKSSIIAEVARRLYRGDTHPSLRHVRHMFGGTSALLIPNSGMFQNDDRMGRIFKRLQPFQDRIVLALDEIHILFAEEYATTHGELLKSILDTTANAFPYFVGATTEEEYRKTIAPFPARERRFQIIHVNPTDEKQTALILREMVNKCAPDQHIPENVFVATHRLTQEKLSRYQQPEISKRILMSAISKIRLQEIDKPIFKLLSTKRVDYQNLLSQLGNAMDDVLGERALVEKLIDIEKEIVDIEYKVSEEAERRAKFRGLREGLVQNKERISLVARQIRNSKNIKKIEKLKIEFIILKYFQRCKMRKQFAILEESLSLSKLNEEYIFNTIEEFVREEDKILSST